MKWLAECSAEALGKALRVVAPELSGGPVTIPVPDPAVKGDPLWWSSSAVVGERFIVKFAWSRPAALRLAHEIGVLTALSREPRVPFLPEVVASSTDPVLLITRLVPGVSLFEIISSIDPDRVGRTARLFPGRLARPVGAPARRGRRRHARWRTAAASDDTNLAGAVREVGAAGSAPGHHALVRLVRCRAHLAWPGRAGARRPAWQQPGVGPGQAPAGGRP